MAFLEQQSNSLELKVNDEVDEKSFSIYDAKYNKIIEYDQEKLQQHINKSKAPFIPTTTKEQRYTTYHFGGDSNVTAYGKYSYCGWLEKKSDVFGRWNKRCIVLTGRRNYYNIPDVYPDSLSQCNTIKISSYKESIDIDTFIPSGTATATVTIFPPGQKHAAVAVKNNVLTIQYWNNGWKFLYFRSSNTNAINFWHDLIYDIINYKSNQINWWDKDICKAQKLVANKSNKKDVINTFNDLHRLNPQRVDIMVNFIEAMRLYDNDDTFGNDERLELYEKMQSLYNYNQIDFRNYCLLLCEMKCYKKLNEILDNDELINNSNITLKEEVIYYFEMKNYQKIINLLQNKKLINQSNITLVDQLTYWFKIYRDYNNTETLNLFVKYVKDISNTLRSNNININDMNINDCNILNIFAKICIDMNCNVEANNYLSFSLKQDQTKIETLDLIILNQFPCCKDLTDAEYYVYLDDLRTKKDYDKLTNVLHILQVNKCIKNQSRHRNINPYWNSIFESINSDKLQIIYMQDKKYITENIKQLSVKSINNFGKMFMNLKNYNEAQSYFELSISIKQDEFETIDLLNKNRKFIVKSEANIFNKANDGVKELAKSFVSLQSKIEKVKKESNEYKDKEGYNDNNDNDTKINKKWIECIKILEFKVEKLCNENIELKTSMRQLESKFNKLQKDNEELRNNIKAFNLNNSQKHKKQTDFI